MNAIKTTPYVKLSARREGQVYIERKEGMPYLLACCGAGFVMISLRNGNHWMPPVLTIQDLKLNDFELFSGTVTITTNE